MKLKRNSHILKCYIWLNQKLNNNSEIPKNTCELVLNLLAGFWIGTWFLVIILLFGFIGIKLLQTIWQYKYFSFKILLVVLLSLVITGLMVQLGKIFISKFKILYKKLKEKMCKSIEIED